MDKGLLDFGVIIPLINLSKYAYITLQKKDVWGVIMRKDSPLAKLANTSEESNICFRPLNPKLKSGLDIVWKKNQVFSPASKIFLSKLESSFKEISKKNVP